ncbi:ABC transporter ATP-binding protein [Bartonella sp. DGB2]|uniref:ABC transporter ATP-binding protein n=1 Tax=Bartonella sp. DGB2 TaxID=3388426 RepID=UPI00398FDDBA
MIELANIDVTFKLGSPLEKRALSDINLQIEAGSFITLIGSNGAGKSTLLSTLAGDVIANHGKILINGADVTRQNTARRAPFIARVFQDPLKGSCGALTIEENLALAAARGHNRGFRAAISHKRHKDFRDHVAQLNLGLEDRLMHRMDSLSGGQRQALSLLMAILADAQVLLLDEHTAALDPSMADFIMDLTEKIIAENKLTTLMVTHSMRQALQFGNRTLMLHSGKIILDVAGDERAGLTVNDLIQKFQNIRGTILDDDKLLMD